MLFSVGFCPFVNEIMQCWPIVSVLKTNYVPWYSQDLNSDEVLVWYGRESPFFSDSDTWLHLRTTTVWTWCVDLMNKTFPW